MKHVSIVYISGMHCASCSVTIEDGLRKIPGIISAQVSYVNGQALVEYDTSKIGYDRIKQAIVNLGYEVISTEDGRRIKALEKHDELHGLKTKLVVGSSLTVLLFLVMVFHPFWGSAWIMALLTAPIQFWVGASFYASAWRALRNKSANMDTLVVLGTSVAYLYSLSGVILETLLQKSGVVHHLYFDASAVVIVLVLLGNYLEIGARGRASSAIRKLMNLQPLIATVQKKDGHGVARWEKIGIEHVIVGDILQVMPGDRIPTDGRIIQGESTVDESMVTGESMPVFKKEGDNVIGGTISKTGTFQMKVMHTGTQTTLARIIELVCSAQGSKAPVQRVVDKISSVFVPVVILLAILTFFLWFFLGPVPQFLNALMNAVAVLVIACPCALGLATPISIMVGMDRAAQEGILIKDVQVLERAGKITMIIFDKTGTITEGRQAVQGFEIVPDVTTIFNKIQLTVPGNYDAETFFAGLVCSLNDLSNHPVSQAISSYLRQQYEHLTDYKIDTFTTLAGQGLKGYFDGHEIIVGTAKALENRQEFSEQMLEVANVWSKEGMSVSFVAIDAYPIAVFGLSDIIRDDAVAAIDRLKAMNISAVMLTGDNEITAQAIAKKVGIEKFFANVKPEDKEKYVQLLRRQGHTVAMVGDGINDAPALASADVGIAMGSGSDVALETAGTALLHNKISLIPKIIVLSRMTMRNIWQNLFWAFGYNIVLIPVAMGILYPFFGIMLNPMLAGVAMAFSSISVVFNALRLHRLQL